MIALAWTALLTIVAALVARRSAMGFNNFVCEISGIARPHEETPCNNAVRDADFTGAQRERRNRKCLPLRRFRPCPARDSNPGPAD